MIGIFAFDVALYAMSRIDSAGERAEVTVQLMTCEPLVDFMIELGLLKRGTTNAAAIKAGTDKLLFIDTAGAERLFILGRCYAGASNTKWRKRRSDDAQWNMASLEKKARRQDGKRIDAMMKEQGLRPLNPTRGMQANRTEQS